MEESEASGSIQRTVKLSADKRGCVNSITSCRGMVCLTRAILGGAPEAELRWMGAPSCPRAGGGCGAEQLFFTGVPWRVGIELPHRSSARATASGARYAASLSRSIILPSLAPSLTRHPPSTLLPLAYRGDAAGLHVPRPDRQHCHPPVTPSTWPAKSSTLIPPRSENGGRL